MPDIEERLQALEQGHKTFEQEQTQLKKTIELQTIAIGALVNKATLEKLNEKHDKLFDTLRSHDHLTNEQLAELREQQIEIDGKVVGLQTEVRQRFNEQDGKIIGLQTEVRQRFSEQDGKIADLQTEVRQRFDEQNSKVASLDSKVASLDSKVASLDSKVASLQTNQSKQTEMIAQILEYLSKK